jgi:S-adenosylmethionine:tRNA ribosyltransferase-isomerase
MDNADIDANALKISDFDYHLPRELIAQTPIEPRDASRLLVVHRASGSLEHRHFYEIGAYLRPGDLLIANQSRVLPARLLGRRAETGGAVEVLLLTERPDLGPDHWETLVRPGRRLREGARIVFGDDASLHAEILQCTEAGGRILRFFVDLPGISTTPRVTRPPDRVPARGAPTIHDRDIAPSQISTDDRSMVGAGLAPALAPIHDEVIAPTVRRLIERVGRIPLPPYIHEPLADPERYQTVYARINGSAAAPTAGLHFTPQLLERLRQQEVRVGFVTLHVGLDTFKPVEREDVSEHKMHSEAIDLDTPTAELINETRSAGGRVIAVGTTSVRVLESVANVTGFHEGGGSQARIGPYCGHTRLFITPGYRFRIVDAMITNFHLPRSTLLLLVSAFAGKQLIEKAYQEAIRERYRFFSFGDAMLLV